MLLHLSSLPNIESSGIAGEDTTRFLDFLVDSGFSTWQTLPLQPVDAFGSPYRSSSVHAGNPVFISIAGKSGHDTGFRESVDAQYRQMVSTAGKAAYDRFLSTHAAWLEDYALYSAIREQLDGKPWLEWPAGLKDRDETELRMFREQHPDSIEHYFLEQFVFFSQWQELRQRAAVRDILLIGDLPIFPGHDSADVWAHRELFKLDAEGGAVVVAGVPPDYFSVTGQRWGNPVYNWDELSKDGFQWWVDRVRTQLELFDILRIDHFRGLEATWEIPAECETAEQGHWQPVPARELLEALVENLGALPFIAEDLGMISPEVTDLRQDFRLPGMVILQFAFDSDADNPYLPHNHRPDSVVYTGTHDNNTLMGWYEGLEQDQRHKVEEYCAGGDIIMPWPMIRMALGSVCNLAILPMQDLLELDAQHRMNTPGTLRDNWQWKFEWDWIPGHLPEKLKHLNQLYGR